jgi:transcriptional regulator with XRE-family HTH domain
MDLERINSLMKELPEKLQALRFYSGINQKQLSKMLGCSQATISKLELGRIELTAKQLFIISELFGVSTDELLQGTIDYQKLAARFGREQLVNSGEEHVLHAYLKKRGRK